MKTIHLFIAFATAVYSYLFYQQCPGINFFVFNLIIVLLLFLKDKSLITKPAWLACAAGSLLSSFCIFWWGTGLPFVANICSLAAVVGLSFNPSSSLLVAGFNTFISVVTSVPRLFYSPIGAQPETNFGNGLKKFVLVLVPVIITLTFVLVYRAANPIFKSFTDQINLNFISFGWCIFTLAGFFAMYGFFKFFAIRKVNEADSNSPDNLPQLTLQQHQQAGMGSQLSVSNELFNGVVLFSLLNLVLLCVNGLDVFYMWIVSRLPQGITLDAYLHDGANTLIFSIVMAIAVILFIFRGYLNFYEGNKWLKALAYVWITQNALLIITTANRNWWVIESLGFTRRRIGIYAYLLLCLVGLATTFIKVMQKKSNWFLFRKNAWAFYAIFITSCFINWDEMIVNYNCQKGNDRYYQSSLSHTSVATLFKCYADEGGMPNRPGSAFNAVTLDRMFHHYKNLKTQVENTGWQSTCISKRQNLDAINAVMNSGKINMPANSDFMVYP
jgi:hypothetical protein